MITHFKYYTLVILFFSLTLFAQKQHVLILQLTKEDGPKNSVALAKQSLKSTGVPEKNILHVGPFSHKEIVNKQAQSKLVKALVNVKEKMAKSERNELLVYLVGHGWNEGVNFSSKKSTNANHWKYVDLSKTLKTIASKEQITLVVDACESGGCIDKCTESAQTIITAADKNSVAWWTSLKNKKGCLSTYTTFSYHFFSALAGEYPSGEKIVADFNRDGIVSYREAYKYTEKIPTLGKIGPVDYLRAGNIPLTKPLFQNEKSNPQYFNNH